MSLQLYLDAREIPAGSRVIRDIDNEWSLMEHSDVPDVVRKALLEIDGSTVTKTGWIKSGLNGSEVRWHLCSTGVKAIWLLADGAGVVDIKECGSNARNFIYSNFRDGAILFQKPPGGTTLPGPSGEYACDVVCRGTHASNRKELAPILEECVDYDRLQRSAY